jgi:signal transduction histidine kinase
MTRQLPYRTRLTLAYTAIVAIAVVLLGAVAFVTVRFTLDTTLDTRLETTAKAIRSVVDVKDGGLKDLDPEDRQQLQDVLGQRVDGAVLRNDGSLLASNLDSPPAAILRAIANRATPRGTVVVGATTVSYVATPIAERGVRYGTAAAWEPRSTYDDAVRITLIALGAAGLIVIVAAAAAGGTLTRRMLRPVTELSAMISDIEATDLTERLAWDGPDDELGRLCTTFDRLLDRLETAFEREHRFIADASHELRTPLSVMRAEVELALMHDRPPEEYRSAFVRLQRETQRLEALAQSLLLTARHDAGALVLTTVEVTGVAERATVRMQALAAARGILLTCDAAANVEVIADAAMLEGAIVALIDNALRFARARVGVGVTATPGAGEATIAVSDDGPGFSAAALREATGRFWRDDPARSGAGTGLGLAIVRSAVERHHGTIALRNGAAGVGAVVVLTVPALRAKSGVIG